MFGCSELSSYALGVEFATIIVSLCALPNLYVSTKCIYGMKLAVEASTNKRGRSYSSGGVSKPVVVMRDKSFAA